MDEKSRTADQMPETIGRYQVQASIGYGAMGAVYKAFDPLIKRTLAIKTIRLDIPKSSPQYKSFLERFYHEARISGTLSHPNIVTLFDIGEEGGLPYLAMEFVDGETIGSMVEKGTRFDPERVIGLVSQMAAAIDYAHSRGVIHRDIKPSNLILAEGDRVKVTDFGIAKLADAEMTQSGALLGTPSYMSPEQAMGDKLDGRSDIFSLGICAFEMLSGEQPFPGTNVTSILYKLVHLPPVEPASLEMSGLVPQKWHEVFGRVLAKKPDDRYQTASAFVQDLELCLGSWFGSAMGEEQGATAIMAAPAAAAVAAGDTSQSTANLKPAKPATPAPAPAVARPEPEPEPTAAMAIPSMPPPSAPAVPKPAPAAPAPAPAPAEEESVATVLMKSPMPAAVEADAATVLMKAPAATAAGEAAMDATRQYSRPSPPPAAPPKPAAPPPPVKAKGKAEAPPKPPAAPASPLTAPVARPAELATPAPPPAPPAARPSRAAAAPGGAKSGGGMAKIAIAAGIGLLAMIVLLGAAVVAIKNHLSAAPHKPTAAPTQATAAAPTAATVPPAPMTVVHVTSDPAGAMIFVDGEAKGITPLDLSGVSMGTHEVRLDLEGYESKTASVDLTTAAPDATVNVALAAHAVAPTIGTGDILSTPTGAAVTFDGQPAGTTPLRGLSLKPGTHRIELRKEGFQPYAGNLVVVAGKHARMAATLKSDAPKITPSPEPPKDTFDLNKVYEEGEVDTRPKRVSGPSSPTYPKKAPSLKSVDKVSVTVTWVVTPSGEIADPQITQSAGKLVDDAVLEMLSKQKYEPGIKKGQKVKVRMLRIYTFRSG
jgi:hypothetical protein